MPVSRQEEFEKSSSAARGRRDDRDGRPSSQQSDPRANQRERTRNAIMDAARKLLLEGRVPSVPDAAHEARVSRATAYRYFPTQGALIREALNGVLDPSWEWKKQLDGPGGLAGRVERATSTLFELMRENEALVRGALLLSLQQWAKLQAGEDLGEEPIQRGGRRPLIQATLEPFEGKIDSTTLRRLAIAISVIVGIEARIVLRDIWHLEEDEAEQIARWMARTLAQAATKEQGNTP
jgi:AcrR family transcriptional regulator